MAATWAVVFGVAALILIAVDRFLHHPPMLTTPWFLISRYVGGGAAAGALFAATLMLAERRGTFATLKTWRVAAWGFVGGAGTLFGFSIYDWFNGAYPPSTPVSGWLWTSFLLASFWGLITGTIAGATLGLARHGADVVNEPSVADRAPVT
jgi:hypothetical protein